MKASHKEIWVSVKTGIGFTQVQVLPGQFIFGRHEAAKELKMKPGSVRNRMEKLKNIGNIDITPDKHFSVISIINWESYQSYINEIGQPPDKGKIKSFRNIENLDRKVDNQLSLIPQINLDSYKASIKKVDNQLDNHRTTTGQPTGHKQELKNDKNVKNKESISHSEVKKFLTHYGERFKFHFGTEPIIEWGKDGAITKNLLKIIPLNDLTEILERFFTSEDKFIQRSGYTIGVFKSQINKLKIGEPLDGMDLWLKVKEEQDARKRQKAILIINEKVEGDIPGKSQ